MLKTLLPKDKITKKSSHMVVLCGLSKKEKKRDKKRKETGVFSLERKSQENLTVSFSREKEAARLFTFSREKEKIPTKRDFLFSLSAHRTQISDSNYFFALIIDHRYFLFFVCLSVEIMSKREGFLGRV